MEAAGHNCGSEWTSLLPGGPEDASPKGTPAADAHHGAVVFILGSVGISEEASSSGASAHPVHRRGAASHGEDEQERRAGNVF